jgi:AcrR family transcriptional regulator
VLRAKPEKIEEKVRVRAALLEATLRLSAAHGFASLGLREVSREASIAPTSFYRHFEDMQALGLAIIRDKVEPFMAELIQIEGGPVSDERTLVDALWSTADRDPELLRFLLAERVGAFADFRAALRDTLQRFASRLASLLAGAAAPQALSETAQLGVVILLDAAAELLDSPADGRAALRMRTQAQLARIWAEARNLGKAS